MVIDVIGDHQLVRSGALQEVGEAGLHCFAISHLGIDEGAGDDGQLRRCVQTALISSTGGGNWPGLPRRRLTKDC